MGALALLACGALLLLLVLVPSGSGTPAFCDRSLANIWCLSVPRDGNNIIWNDPLTGNTSRPWVFNYTVSLTAGTYRPGPAPWTALPTVYILGSGRLNIHSEIVEMQANIFVCDAGILDIKDSTFRVGAESGFQYSMWASGTSQVLVSNVTLYTISEDKQNSAPSTPGAWLVVIRDHATMTSSRLTEGRPHSVDVLELAAVDDAHVEIDQHAIFSETYIAQQATFINSNSYFFDVFFEFCPGTTISLPTLPVLCSIDGTGPLPTCNSPGHQPISFNLSVPGGFNLQITNGKVFSWAASTFDTTAASFNNIPKDANFAVGLNIGNFNNTIYSYHLQMTGKDEPSVTGIEQTRTLTFGSDVYVLVWHVWPSATNLQIDIDHSNSVGDILPGSDSLIRINGMTLQYGQVRAPAGTVISFTDCAINEQVVVLEGGTLVAINTTFTQPAFDTYSDVFIIDSPLPTLTISAGGILYFITIYHPVDGLSLPEAQDIVVTGTVYSLTTGGVPTSPFTPLDIGFNGQFITTIVAPVENGTLAFLTRTQFIDGTNRLTFQWQADVNGSAIVTRNIYLPSSASQLLSMMSWLTRNLHWWASAIQTLF